MSARWKRWLDEFCRAADAARPVGDSRADALDVLCGIGFARDDAQDVVMRLETSWQRLDAKEETDGTTG